MQSKSSHTKSHFSRVTIAHLRLICLPFVASCVLLSPNVSPVTAASAITALGVIILPSAYTLAFNEIHCRALAYLDRSDKLRGLAQNSHGMFRRQLMQNPTSRFLGMANNRKRMNCDPCDFSRNKIKTYAMSSDSSSPHDKCRPLVIVLAGPTAVGKSDVAAELCSHSMATEIMCCHQQAHTMTNSNESKEWSNTTARLETRGHVISADSVQVYRGVSIGANKPSLEDMERTPHHLVDIVDPPNHDIACKDEEGNVSVNGTIKVSSYNAADWMRDAEYVIQKLTLHEAVDAGDGDQNDNSDTNNQEIVRRRNCIDDYFNESVQTEALVTSRIPILPVVVGGTMFYLNWLVHGRPDAVRPTEEALKRAADMISKFQGHSESGAAVRCDDGGHHRDDEIDGPVKQGNTVDEEADRKQEAVDERAWTNASEYVSSLGPVLLVECRNYAEGIEDEEDEATILSNLTENEVYTGIRSGGLSDLGYDVRCFFLCPDDRMLHFHAVDKRCEEMLCRGLLRETADLFLSGGLPEDSQVTRAIGYRQSLDYLLRKDAKMNDHDTFLTFVDNFATATRQYAKKQMQWFRRDREFAFIPIKIECNKEDRVKDAAKLIADMCQLSRNDFDAQLTFDIDDIAVNEAETSVNVQLPLPARTKLANEQQGKGMKFFISKRNILTLGSAELRDVMAEADKCTILIQRLEAV
ncbi:hypothetical protein HJC23_004399 [Cyclotella cryptica]|uniref:tRNA dimethylallyltransferase n=1 Tax=Cyclotella cryptica TaxID=29204 RepID=A0ABD3NRL8_9STRA